MKKLLLISLFAFITNDSVSGETKVTESDKIVKGTFFAKLPKK